MKGTILNLNSQLSSDGFVVLSLVFAAIVSPCPDALVMLPPVAPGKEPKSGIGREEVFILLFVQTGDFLSRKLARYRSFSYFFLS
ncbi:hypothetical protein C5167_019628 [Papaver somniferum]|uniref:Uncharacterized protein n=1 Tax=Papaver somniferum TaxID=3469 RepID=A0A4Y7IU17_PAPSO|nr:hypothetical protein C5167_019628 [Papaver somniferum]